MIAWEEFQLRREDRRRELGALGRAMRGRGMRRRDSRDVDRLAALARLVSGDPAPARRDCLTSEPVPYLEGVLASAQAVLYRHSGSGPAQLPRFLAIGPPLRCRRAGRHAAGPDLQFCSLTVPHGVLELPEIGAAAGAGFRPGHAVMRPGLATRGAAVTAAALPAVELAIGASCLLIVAGLIEGFITTWTLPEAAKLGVGLGSRIPCTPGNCCPGGGGPVSDNW